MRNFGIILITLLIDLFINLVITYIFIFYFDYLIYWFVYQLIYLFNYIFMYTFFPVFIYLSFWLLYLLICLLIYLFAYIFTYCLINHLYLYYRLKYWIIYINFQFSDVESIETSLEEKESEIDSDSPDVGFALDPNGQVCSVSLQEKNLLLHFFSALLERNCFQQCHFFLFTYLCMYVFIY